MDKFVVYYVKDGKEYKEFIELPKNENSSAKRAFNEFFRKMKKRGFNKDNVKVSNIYKT